jgi:hypothetical protein
VRGGFPNEYGGGGHLAEYPDDFILFPAFTSEAAIRPNEQMPHLLFNNRIKSINQGVRCPFFSADPVWLFLCFNIFAKSSMNQYIQNVILFHD